MEKRRMEGQRLLARLNKPPPGGVTTARDKSDIRDILAAGCDWSKAVNNDGHTVLHLVAKQWDDIMLRILLDHGIRAFNRIINVNDNKSTSAFHLACKVQNIKVRDFLLDHMTDTDMTLHSCDSEGTSPLSTVIRHLDVAFVEKMLARGACSLYPDTIDYGNPFYSIRYQYNHCVMNDMQEGVLKARQIFTLLLEQGPPSELCRKLGIVAEIPDLRNCIQRFVLVDAEELHILLFERGWVKVALYQNPAHWFTNPFVETVLKEDLVKLLRVLHKHGVDLTSKNGAGGHILHDATLRRASKVVRFLVDDILLDTNTIHPLFQQTALHVAAKWNLAEIALILIKRSANVYLKDKRGKTPLEIAIDRKCYDAARVLIYIPCQYPAEVISSSLSALCPPADAEGQQDEDEDELQSDQMRKYILNAWRCYPRSLVEITAEFMRMSMGSRNLLTLLKSDELPQKCKAALVLQGVTVQDILL